jgi:diaminopimelate epimerase
VVRVPFVKMHGAGNDFVVVDRRAVPALARADAEATAAFVRAACDRRHGVGADGVLFLDAGDAGGDGGRGGGGLDFRMRYFNRDGGRADLCGNGGRCLAAFAAARGLGRDGRLVFASDAGRHEARVEGERVELVLGDVEAPVLGRRLETAAGVVEAARVSVGVPHLVVEVADVAAIDLAAFAPPLRAHPSLGAAGANVDVAQVVGPRRVRLRTFERGVEGETLACGTGAAATAVVLVAAGRVEAPVDLEVASGDVLTVSFERRDGGFRAVTLAGPVATSFEGVYSWTFPGPPPGPDS